MKQLEEILQVAKDAELDGRHADAQTLRTAVCADAIDRLLGILTLAAAEGGYHGPASPPYFAPMASPDERHASARALRTLHHGDERVPWLYSVMPRRKPRRFTYLVIGPQLFIVAGNWTARVGAVETATGDIYATQLFEPGVSHRSVGSIYDPDRAALQQLCRRDAFRWPQIAWPSPAARVRLTMPLELANHLHDHWPQQNWPPPNEPPPNEAR